MTCLEVTVRILEIREATRKWILTISYVYGSLKSFVFSEYREGLDLPSRKTRQDRETKVVIIWGSKAITALSSSRTGIAIPIELAWIGTICSRVDYYTFQSCYPHREH
jgi:hypothetical protein